MMTDMASMTKKKGRGRGMMSGGMVLVAVLSLLAAAPVHSQPPQLASGHSPQEIKYHNDDIIKAHYAPAASLPIWVRGAGAFQPRIDAVLEILEESWTHGLNPAHYRVTEIRERKKNFGHSSKMELEMLISDSVLRYIHDLSSMRGQPQSADAKNKFWREPLDRAALLKDLSSTRDPVATIRGYAPHYALYQALRQELVRLAALPDRDAKPIRSGGELLKPGRSYAQIPAIRARLGLSDPETRLNAYDEPLAVEIMAFQRSYGLKADGIIGPKTLDLLNISNRDRMMQIIANMERLRWMNEGRPDRYVLVNIPSATLWAVEDGEARLTMPVIVGKTARPTYSFRTEITGIRFNPNWTVPPTIKRKDFLPMLQQDPYALSERGIGIYYQGRPIDPGQVDWHTIDPRDLASLRMTQSPGDDNPLGKIRVLMENPYNIYLHDTNNPSLFSQPERELSSGCIRVAEPHRLAEFIMGRNEKWNENSLRRYIDSGRMRDIQADEALPVYITYQTVWLDTNGRLIYGRDVYGQDKILIDLLQKRDFIHIPEIFPNPAISL
ncbi:MAG: L,D-transpeptidase family protein [Micavibrio sp.]